MTYGFLIDNDRCIGCHACSTACKSENDVPLGVQRTWVKSVETGVHPNVRRSFQVTRCNHCSNPPCVRICPVTAMYQRSDGIVEFDPDECIGCKACMQACPYDAIYIDPESGTAAKCHYCAHRIEIGLEPACVVVCPEHAILAGDLDDPTTEIAKAVAEHTVTVRKPEQGTAPKVFYKGGEDVAMHPTATMRTPETFAWADVIPLHPERDTKTDSRSAGGKSGGGGTGRRPGIRNPGPQGAPQDGPIQIGDTRLAEQMTQVVFNAQHRVPWHWPVALYLVTKGIGTGLFMMLSIAWGLDYMEPDPWSFQVAGMLSLAFTVITTALLVLDLERPERFLRILMRGQWNSWLVKGAYLLVGFSMISVLWLAGEWATSRELIETSLWSGLRPMVVLTGFFFALGSAVYTAFLFGQAEGRDLWQSPLLPPHLIIQAFLAGSALLLVVDPWVLLDAGLLSFARTVFASSLLLDVLVTLFGEFAMPHASELAARAAHEITRGYYARHFWVGFLLVGRLIPFGLLLINQDISTAGAGILALIGLYSYEYAFVMAPQELPNS